MENQNQRPNKLLGRAFGPLQKPRKAGKIEEIAIGGDLTRDKQNMLAYGLAKCVINRQAVSLGDNSNGLFNPERKGQMVLRALCAHQQGIQLSNATREGFGWKDVRWLPRYPALYGDQCPTEISARGAIMGAVREMLDGELEVLLDGFDPSIPWAERGWVWLWAAGNGPLGDELAIALSEALGDCTLLGLHYEHPRSEAVYAYLMIPLTEREVRNSCYSFLLDNPHFKRALETILAAPEGNAAGGGLK